MKNFTRVLTLMLALTMVIGMFTMPASAAENDTDNYMLLEVSDTQAVLRSKAEQSGSVCVTVRRGDVLYCTDRVTNRHGNVWFQCLFVSKETGVKQTGWIFSGRITQHQHQMNAVDGDSALNLSYCKCGHFNSNPQGMQQMNSLAIPMDRPLISPEKIAVALGALKAAGVKLGSAAISAVPYVLIPFAVAGVGYMAYVHCNTTSTEIVDVKKMTKNYRPSDYEIGKYYYSAIYREPTETGGVYSTVLILPAYGMDMRAAATYMERVIAGSGLLRASIDNLTVTIDSVYTPIEQDAKRLCKELRSHGFYYGTSSCADEHSEYNTKNLTANWLYFEHYHVYYDPLAAASGITPNPGSGFLKKASGHIFFGIPFSYNGYPLERF